MRKFFVAAVFLSFFLISSAVQITVHELAIKAPDFHDPCSAYGDSCINCLSHTLCGWCSNPVVYQDGARGSQCAGFDESNGTTPWTCSGIYSTEKCVVGYECVEANQSCVPVAPGDGVPLSVCEQTCAPPPSYICVDNACQSTAPNNGTNQLVCQQTCGLQPQNYTPPALVGVWRGLQISNGYLAGEWDAQFNDTYFALRTPTGVVTIEGDVAVLGPYLVLYITGGHFKGQISYALWQLFYGPTTLWMTLALSDPGFPIPNSFDAGMSGLQSTEFVFQRCLQATNCIFTFPDTVPLHYVHSSEQHLLSRASALPENQKDHCSPYPNCSACVENQWCGWCSVAVMYQDGSAGYNCAGFNPYTGETPFVCNGVYTTEDCPVPAQTYACQSSGSTNNTCVPTTAGQGTSLQVCQATCGVAPAQTYTCNTTSNTCSPTTPGQGTSQLICNQTCGQVMPPPVALDGEWRGLQIREGYSWGEWTLEISVVNETLKLTDPSGAVYSGKVYLLNGELLIVLSTPQSSSMYASYNLAQGPETYYLTIALSASGDTAAPTFDQAMTAPGENEFAFIKCLTPYCVFR